MGNQGGGSLMAAGVDMALVLRIFDPFSEENPEATGRWVSWLR